jgi:CDP-diglyceride synthetase
MIDVQSTLDRLHKEIKNRDRMDTMSLAIAIPAFVFSTYFVPFTLSKIASGFVALWSVYLIIRLRKAKKNKPGAFTGTYVEYLNKTREFLLSQKQLMDTVLYWAIIPFIVFSSMFFIGFMERPDVTVTRTISLCGGSFVLSLIVYFLNKWAVKNQILPRLEKVDELIKVMEKE